VFNPILWLTRKAIQNPGTMGFENKPTAREIFPLAVGRLGHCLFLKDGILLCPNNSLFLSWFGGWFRSVAGGLKSPVHLFEQEGDGVIVLFGLVGLFVNDFTNAADFVHLVV